MKTLSAGMLTHLAQDTTTLATGCKITRMDGTVYGFTDHDVNVALNADGLGTITYYSVDGFSRTALDTTEGVAADNSDLQFIFDDDRVTDEDLLAGLFLRAEVKFFWFNWTDPAMAVIKGLRGFLGEVTLNRDTYVFQMQSLASLLSQDMGEVYTPDCRAVLGDNRCQVVLAIPAWTATTAYSATSLYVQGTRVVALGGASPLRQFRCITAGTSGATEPTWNTTLGAFTSDGTVAWITERAFQVPCTVDTLVAAAYGDTHVQQFTVTPTLADFVPVPTGGSNYFTGGRVLWLTGDNAGLGVEVKSFDAATSAITLFLPMWDDIQVGDTLTLEVGCDKLRDTCHNKFFNIVNMRGEPFLPGLEEFLRFPDVPG